LTMTTYHHGVRVVEINEGTRPIRTVQTGIVGGKRFDLRAHVGELLLVGRAEQLGPDNWQVRWTTWTNGQGKNLTLSGSPTSASARAVDMVANALVNRFTVAGGEASMLELVVENIVAVDDYAQVLKYLAARSFVKNLSVARLAGDELTLQISTTSSPEKFLQLLAIDSRLVESDRPRQRRSLPAREADVPATTEAGDFGARSMARIVDKGSIRDSDRPDISGEPSRVQHRHCERS